jgi:hypothetical protein
MSRWPAAVQVAECDKGTEHCEHAKHGQKATAWPRGDHLRVRLKVTRGHAESIGAEVRDRTKPSLTRRWVKVKLRMRNAANRTANMASKPQ